MNQTNQWLKIAHIGDPNRSGILVIGKMHLFPGLDELDCVDPLVTTRSPHVVEVIVHTSSGRSVGFVCKRHTNEIPRVIVGPEKSD